ncbi:MAG: YciI family protein [Bacteroidota bacterium]
MKHSYLFSLLALSWLWACQTPEKEIVRVVEKPTFDVDTTVFETFEHRDGDTTYLMKKYFMCFLKTGPKRDHGEAEAAALQEQHLAHLSQLATDKKICSAGPFGDDGDIRGIVIYSVPTLEDALALANADPAVKAGRLAVEVHPWWAAVGTTLFAFCTR